MKYGLIGFPLEQSFSKKYFTEKFKLAGNKAIYENFPLESLSSIHELISNNPDLKGLNVTIPHKVNVVSYLNKVDAVAEKIGAVNVIKIEQRDNQPFLTGYNTDVMGFERSLIPLLKNHHAHALILGTGGASKAVAYALNRVRIDYKYVSRTKSENILSYEELSPEIMQQHQIIINCTPLGMFPKTEELPLIPYEHLTSKHLLYDLIYNPEETAFLAEGKKAGASTKNGYEMLLIQAREAWAIWKE